MTDETPKTPEQVSAKADTIHGQLFCAIFAAMLNREGVTWEAAFSEACNQASAAADSYRLYFGGPTLEATVATPQLTNELRETIKGHFDEFAKTDPDAVNAILHALASAGVVI